QDFIKNGKLDGSTFGKLKTRVNKLITYPAAIGDSIYSYLLFQDMEKLRKIRYKKSQPDSIESTYYKRGQFKGLATGSGLVLRSLDHGFFAATSGKGLHFIIDDTIISYAVKQGLLSDNIKVLKKWNDSTLLAGTNKGLNILFFSRDQYPVLKSSKFITTKDGLKGNEIHDIAIYKDHIILATNNGVSLILPSEVLKIEDVFPIYITDFVVNGEKRELNGNIYLAHDENNIQIKFDAIDFHDKDEIVYYYRLIGTGDFRWVELDESSVMFPVLPPGSYTYQVRAKNSYGYRSQNTAVIHFEIQQIFYKATWFKILISILLMALIVGFLYIFFSSRNEKLRNEKILASYHQQSLTRVLNPHFIFNALNSVNSFIINNRKKEATYYITQIAGLIRQIFNSATDTTISIRKEADLLKAYLELEQRRIKASFNFIIKIEDQLDDFLIPSFMIQIFAENSVWHGFSDLKGKGALISIVFRKKNGFVVCTITDNGIGRQKAALEISKKSNTREQHGTNVIVKRIDLLNTSFYKQKISLNIVDVMNDDTGRALGTLVRLKFPFIKN
ncbi:MAG: hypothetical protein GQ527_00965, partial [Bacteroidales bacterium]|nr:hypothetical protein [Bacteroidales bacterium]